METLNFSEHRLKKFSDVKNNRNFNLYLGGILNSLELLDYKSNGFDSYILYDVENDIQYNLVHDEDVTTLTPDLLEYDNSIDMIVASISDNVKVAKMEDGMFSITNYDIKNNKLKVLRYDEFESFRIGALKIDPAYIKDVEYMLEHEGVKPSEVISIKIEYSFSKDPNKLIVSRNGYNSYLEDYNDQNLFEFYVDKEKTNKVL